MSSIHTFLIQNASHPLTAVHINHWMMHYISRILSSSPSTPSPPFNSTPTLSQNRYHPYIPSWPETVIFSSLQNAPCPLVAVYMVSVMGLNTMPTTISFLITKAMDMHTNCRLKRQKNENRTDIPKEENKDNLQWVQWQNWWLQFHSPPFCMLLWLLNQNTRLLP